jgi:hypothetical protein
MMRPLLDADVNVDDELLERESVSSEALELLALLFLSFPAMKLVDELPLPLLLPSPTGLSRSNPNCSKDRLNDVVLFGSVRCSCGGC